MSGRETQLEHEQGHEQKTTGFFRGNISVLALGNAVRSLGGFVGIYIPYYFVQIGGDPLSLGLLGSASSIIQFFTLAIGGLIADYHGRRKVIVLSAFYGVFFPLLYAIVADWRLFGLFTVLAAIGTISNPAIHATVADSLHPQRRATGIAYLQVVSSLPMMVSPLVGGWLIESYGLESGFRLACVYATVFVFFSALVFLVSLRETRQSSPPSNNDPRLQDAFSGLTRFSSLRLPSDFKVLISSYSMVVFANSAVAQYYLLFAIGVAGLSAWDWGVVASLQLVVASVLRIPGGWIGDRVGKRKIMVISLLTTIPVILWFALSRSFVQVLVAYVLLAVTGIYYAPAYEALQADFTPKLMRGRMTAVWDMSSAISAALGAFIGGFTFQTIGPAVPFYVFAVAELGATLLLVAWVREPQVRET